MLRTLTSVSFFAVGVACFFSSAQASRQATSVPGEVLIGFHSGFAAVNSESALRSALTQILGPNSVKSVHALQMDSSIQKVTLTDATKTAAAITQIKHSLAGVKVAEPNFIYRANILSGNNGEPNDADFSKQWDMKNTGQADKPEGGQDGQANSDINVVPLWKDGIIGDRKMLVAVVDTGVDYTHPDLAANAYKNVGEIAGNGIDDDQNGVIDDVYGANFVSGAGVGNGMDDNNHGTHCAGSIGAVGNDGSGISGVNWQVSILSAKFLSAGGGGSLEGAINAVKYSTKMGAKVISNSWGGGGYSELLKAAIEESNAAGALFVAASGNDGANVDSEPVYPASYEVANVVSVAATDNRDQIASFSNYGRRTVHVAAPGKNIYSTVRNGKYATYSGTSMATPHVAGVAALIWAANPTWTAAEVKRRLIETSTPVAALRKKSASNGRVNAFNAFHGIVTPSDEPAESAWKSIDFSAESAHPYANGANVAFEVSAPGAKFIRIVFEKFETEARYDTVSLVNETGETIEVISGVKSGEYVTDYVKGDKAFLRLKTDTSENRYGFKIAKIQIVD